MNIDNGGQTPIAYTQTGNGERAVLWAHGWGQTHAAFQPLAQSLASLARHTLIDFPGFGASSVPPGVWGAAEYADALAEFLRNHMKKPALWIGHSFGCRVGIQLASRHPDLVSGLVLIAAAGLPRKRPLHLKLYWKFRIKLFKLLKRLVPEGAPREKLYKIFGSPDYQNAGPLRQIFVKVVNENLSDIAGTVSCPVLLIYGTRDTETPLELGERYKQLIPNAELVSLDGLDHYTVLTDGRHQVAPLIKNFIEKI